MFQYKTLNVHINSVEVKKQASLLKDSLMFMDERTKIQNLLFVTKCIDLTTLAGDDCQSCVWKLCWRANNPFKETVIRGLKQKLNVESFITTAAVCVYPLRVADCRDALEKLESNLPIASVVAGFPSGQSPVSSTLNEIKFATEFGAKEIDIVINRTLVLTGQWKKLYQDIKNIAEYCKKQKAHLKVIISAGELSTIQNVYKASMCAMMAGADFIKTSTGKETKNAKLVFGLTMARAINDFFDATGIIVGLKPAGGIQSVSDALLWVELVRSQLGPKWTNKQFFRIGASSLLDNIESHFEILLNKI